MVIKWNKAYYTWNILQAETIMLSSLSKYGENVSYKWTKYKMLNLIYYNTTVQ
jgi:hypothetical protein